MTQMNLQTEYFLIQDKVLIDDSSQILSFKETCLECVHT